MYAPCELALLFSKIIFRLWPWENMDCFNKICPNYELWMVTTSWVIFKNLIQVFKQEILFRGFLTGQYQLKTSFCNRSFSSIIMLPGVLLNNTEKRKILSRNHEFKNLIQLSEWMNDIIIEKLIGRDPKRLSSLTSHYEPERSHH